MTIETHTPPSRELSQHLTEAATGSLIVLKGTLENATSENILSVKTMQDLGYMGIYITLTKDYGEIAATMAREGVQVGSIKFIDGIAHMYGIGESQTSGVTYVSGPLALDQIFDELKKHLEGDPSKKFVFLDSLTVILLYNALDLTKTFIKKIHALLRKHGATGIVSLVSQSSANTELIHEIQSLGGVIVLPR